MFAETDAVGRTFCSLRSWLKLANARSFATFNDPYHQQIHFQSLYSCRQQQLQRPSVWLHDHRRCRQRALACLSSSLLRAAQMPATRTMQRALHTTAVSLTRVRTREVMLKMDQLASEEKVKQQKKEKSKVGKKGMVHVWQDITVLELSRVLKVDVDKVFEFMLYVDGADRYDRPNAKIRNMRVVEEICKVGGYRWQIIKAPAIIAANALLASDEDARMTLKHRPPAAASALQPRPPVVCIMGHVDHGKTTLLDALRNTRVVDQEFGGITQHIGAFTVTLPFAGKQESVTFLDTPGHAAFAAMRSRGAHVTDIVVLVVAADDGVMEQTRESIRYARNAHAVLLVALNKCDKPSANIEAAKRMLWTENVELEDYGGDVQCVAISALKRQGLNELIEAVITQAEVMQLRADPTGLVEAIVIESRNDAAKGGRLVTVIVQRGTLKKADCVVAGLAYAKVRNIFDSSGNPLEQAPPGVPCEVLGWHGLPDAGEEVFGVQDENFARQVMAYRERKRLDSKADTDWVEIEKKRRDHLKTYKEQLERRNKLSGQFKRLLRPITLATDAMQRQQAREAALNKKPHVALLIKGDVQGSVEAILNVLETFSSTKCELHIVSSGVGAVNENDIYMADTFRALIYAFNVPVHEKFQQEAQAARLRIKSFNIIYRLVEDLQSELTAILPPKHVEEITGEAQVLQQFLVSAEGGGKKKRPVAGCRCTKGTLVRKEGHTFRVVRDEQIIYDGPVVSMKHFKAEVNEVLKEQECGLMFDVKEPPIEFIHGDTVVCYTMVTQNDTIDWSPPGF